MQEQVDSMEQRQAQTGAQPGADVAVQAGAYLLELSLDWIVLRASENIHHLLRDSHVTLIGEPLGKFVKSQALHDLRNMFSRLSGTTGIARAYHVRLTDNSGRVDIAFHLSGGRVLFEAAPSIEEVFGTAFGTVGGLAAGLARTSGQALLDAGARRMRALTGFDRVTLLVGDEKATSDRSGVPFRSGANATLSDNFPPLVADAAAASVPVFPRKDDASTSAALLRAPTADEKAELAERGFASTMRIQIVREGESVGEFRLAHTKPLPANLETHAAAELFAQLFALRLEIDQLKHG